MRGLRPLLLACVASVGIAAAPAGAQTVLRAVPINDLKNLDPIWTTAYITRNHGYFIFDTLFSMDADLKPQPQMVERYEVSGDKLKYTFVVRDGLKWHDGQKVTAADCVASLQRWGKKDVMGQTLMSFAQGLDAVDEKTFTLTLKEPVGFVLEALGKVDSIVPFMMPERLAKTDPNTQITEMIGSGPFKFAKDEWVPGNKVVYLKNADYVPRKEPSSLASGGKVVKIDRFEWIYIPEPSTAIAALNAGEIDVYELPPPDLLKLMRASPNITVMQADKMGSQAFLRLNHLHPPFNDPRARQAVLWATKQEDYLQAAFGDPANWRKCPAFFGCGSPSESSAGSDGILKPDLAKAKQLLAASGYKGEPIIFLDATDISFLHTLDLVGVDSLKTLGLNVDIQSMDFSTVTARRAKREPPGQGGWHVFITAALVSGMMDPVLNAYAGAGCEKALFGWPCDPKLEQLRLDWARAGDPAEKKKIVDQIQAQHMENVTYVPLGQYVENIAFNKKVQGLIQAPARFYWNVSKAE